MAKEKIDTEKNARFMEVVQWLIDNGKAANQGDLCVKAGYGPNIISRISHNHNTVSEDTIRTLCEKFHDANIDYIRKGTGCVSRHEVKDVKEVEVPNVDKIPALDYSFLIEKAVEKATSYADKTISTLEKQVADKDETIKMLKARIHELEGVVNYYKNKEQLSDYPFQMGVSDKQIEQPSRV